MDKENNLTDFLTDVANAIRVKKGTEELINPQDFSSEIKSIKSDPVLVSLSKTYDSNITETIKPSDGVDGFNSVTIEVAVGDAPSLNIQSKEVAIEENGSTKIITPDRDMGYDYMDEVIVSTNIPMQEKSVTYNDNVSGVVIEADSGYGGLSKVTVNVDVPNQGSDVSIEPVRTVGITENNHTRDISPAVGYDALAGVNVSVNIPLQDKEVEIRETGETLISADATYEGLNSVKVTPILEAKTTTITANNTYLISASEGNCGIGAHTIIVSVPTGGGGTTPPVVESKDVNFYDYDGTLLYSYTTDEVAVLTSLPPAPSAPEGLDLLSGSGTWNYTLDEIKDLGGMCDVGAVYSREGAGMTLFLDIPIDGITITSGIKGSASTSKYTIDWGDGSTESVTGTTAKSHSYSSRGQYKVKFDITFGTLGLTINQNVMGDDIKSTTNRSNSIFLRRAVIGTGCTLTSAFKYCGGLETCILSPEVSVAANMFSDCSSLKALMTQGNISISAFFKCSSLKVVSMPLNSVVAGVSAFGNCFSLKRLILPNKTSGSALPACYSSCSSLSVFKIYKGYNSINAAAFDGHYGLSVLDLSDYDFVPALSGSVSSMKVSQGVKIWVKSNMEEGFKSASNWSSISSVIVGV